MSQHPSFVFAVCQVGAETFLKRDVARSQPHLRPAFARPGFLTFKSAASRPETRVKSAFARHSGIALGAARDAAQALEHVRQLRRGRPVLLQVFARDRVVPDKETVAAASGSAAEVAQWEMVLRQSADPGMFDSRLLPRPGDTVVDVIVLERDALWIGWHEHDVARLPHPGGRAPVVVPQAAPSRAYAKVVEGIAWAGAAMSRGQTAIEIGSAPGGATYALLERGIDTIGIDPGNMAPLQNFAAAHGCHFTHVQQAVGDVDPATLPHRIDWILIDMNCAPAAALAAALPVVRHALPGLRGMFFTCKINEERAVSTLPKLTRRLRDLGLTHVRCVQLASHRRELLLFASPVA